LRAVERLSDSYDSFLLRIWKCTVHTVSREIGGTEALRLYVIQGLMQVQTHRTTTAPVQQLRNSVVGDADNGMGIEGVCMYTVVSLTRERVARPNKRVPVDHQNARSNK
jgi:hypothetical protein